MSELSALLTSSIRIAITGMFFIVLFYITYKTLFTDGVREFIKYKIFKKKLDDDMVNFCTTCILDNKNLSECLKEYVLIKQIHPKKIKDFEYTYNKINDEIKRMEVKNE
jgi:hypothetical protein